MINYELKYGLNPHQGGARVLMPGGGTLPFEIINGRPGYINFLDALNGWQLVRELRLATGLPAAASFKHLSPAGTAVAGEISPELKMAYFIPEGPLTPLASAFAKARGADRLSSYGDFIALSDICDKDTARLISQEVSDGVIAPGYMRDALEILKAKRRGSYNVIEIDPSYEPDLLERREVFGVLFEQNRNEAQIDRNSLINIVTEKKDLTDASVCDLLIALITLKYTQSNSVCYVKNGQAIGIGAGQQSRVHCVRLAGDKADNWRLRQHEKTLSLPWLAEIPRPARDNAIDAFISPCRCRTLLDNWRSFFTEEPRPITEEERTFWLSSHKGTSLGSDAFFPFDDSIERASESGVSYIAAPSGSLRDDMVISACDRHGIVMSFCKARLFHH